MRTATLLLLALLPGAGVAADLHRPELPPTQVVEKVLREHPLVKSAGHHVQAEEANRDRLEAGPHEWNLRMTRQQREVRTNPGERFGEWEAILERPLRLPGKANLDKAVGDAGVAAARIAKGDALHETSRMLLSKWFEWQRLKAATAAWSGQAEVLERQSKAVTRRQELGDASRLEMTQAQAAAAQARSQLAQVRSREESARLELERLFPGLPLPEGLVDATPAAPEGNAATWMEAILEHDHELGLARAEARRMGAAALRSDRENLPDPTVGLKLARERGGEESIAGLSLSFALPGAGRAAGARSALAQSDAAAQREAAMLRKVSAEAAALIRTASASHAAWLESRRAADALEQAAGMAEKAYALGEGSLSDTLFARRTAFEARLSADEARLTALEKHDRLLLDAHRLWDLDGDEEQHEGQH